MSGSFKHRNADYFECKKSLRTITYAPGTMTYESETNTCDHLETPSLEVSSPTSIIIAPH